MNQDINPKEIINFLQRHLIQNYLESTERLFLQTIIEKLKKASSDELTEKELQELIRLYKKYKRFSTS